MVTVPQVVRVAPPEHLMAPTPEPVCDPCEINADLLQWALDLRQALRAANADKTAIKQSVGDGK